MIVIENLIDDTPSMRFTTAMDLLLLLNVGGQKHTRDSMVKLMTEAGLRVGEVTPVNAYLHALHSTVGGGGDRLAGHLPHQTGGVPTARNSGRASTFRRKPTVMHTPSPRTRSSSRTRSIRASARSRSGAQTTALASSES